MLRKLAIFADEEGNPIAIRADRIIAVECNLEEHVPKDSFTIFTDEYVSEDNSNSYYVKGDFKAIVSEIETCLA